MNRASTLALVLLTFSGAATAKDLVGVFEDAVHTTPVIRQADANRLAARELAPRPGPRAPQLNGTASATSDHTPPASSPFSPPARTAHRGDPQTSGCGYLHQEVGAESAAEPVLMGELDGAQAATARSPRPNHLPGGRGAS